MAGGRRNRSRRVRLPHLLWGTVRRRSGYRHRAVFVDPAVQRDLEVAGYHITPTPIVPKETVATLLDACAEWQAMTRRVDDGRFYFSGARPPTPAAEHARGRIWKLLVPHIAALVDPAEARVGPSVFQMKPSGPESGIRSHQDPFLVDERRSFTVATWTALTYVHAQSGPMIVLPGSHRFACVKRVATTTDDLADYHEVIERHARMVTLSPGQTLLFDGALIHGSLVNKSGALRIGASCMVLPTTSPITAPVPVDGPPPETTDLYRMDPARATGPRSEGFAEAEHIGRTRLDRLAVGPSGLDLTCRLQRHIGRDAGGQRVPEGMSTA